MRLTDGAGVPLKEETYTLRRTILWRPFIIDLSDTRLPRHQPRNFSFTFPPDADSQPVKLEVVVRYHLLDEARRRRIGYENPRALHALPRGATGELETICRHDAVIEHDDVRRLAICYARPALSFKPR
jgi:hypothetical protein